MPPTIAIDAAATDLAHDPQARRARKRAVLVDVEFASAAGVLQTREGPVSYRAGDALLTGAIGERWPVARDRFDATYEPVPPTVGGTAGSYRKRPLVVIAKRMEGTFTVGVGPAGDRLIGHAGDWLIQYGPGNFGVVSSAAFDQTYELIEAG